MSSPIEAGFNFIAPQSTTAQGKIADDWYKVLATKIAGDEMVRISIPLGKGSTSFEVPKANLLGIINPFGMRGAAKPADEIRKALLDPIGTGCLSELLKPHQKVVIVVTDHTRPCPDSLILPLLLNELEAAGIRPPNITVVIGTGMHRPMREDEIRARFSVAGKVRIVNHNPLDPNGLTYLGKTSTGGRVFINTHVAEADFVIAVGVVEPHQYAGFSGGRKLIAVGVAGVETIAHTHQPRFIDAEGTRLGKLEDNPFHHELVEVASRTNLRFAINVVLNAEKQLVGCFAGEPNESFKRAVKLARRICIRPVKRQADILILGVGHPKDINLYQASRGVTYAYFASKPAIREGGIIILAAACPEGTGDSRFENFLKRAQKPREAIAKGKRLGLKPGEQRAYMLARVLENVRITVAGSALSPKLLQRMFLDFSPTVEGALEKAFGELGKDTKVLVIPYSLLTIPILR
jgi:nickel-dependent lactate racemase